jgi:hypothetical protein
MTDTKSLSERLRERAEYDDLAMLPQAADALDAKDAEIELLKEGRKLHDELADHLEHELAAQSALLAQAATALEAADEAINPPDRGGISMDTWNKRLKVSTTTIREALAAIRAKGVS